MALALLLTALAPLAAEPSPAAAGDCTTVGCAPTGFTVYPQGEYAYPFTSLSMCGTENSFATELLNRTDTVDNPDFLPSFHTEGNYKDSAAFSFTPAPGTSIGTGDTITLTMPKPDPARGATFPPAVQPYSPVAAEEDGVVTAAPIAGSNPPAYTVEVTLPGRPAGTRVRLDSVSRYATVDAKSGPGTPNPVNAVGTTVFGFDPSAGTYGLAGSYGTTSTAGAPAGTSKTSFVVINPFPKTIAFAATDIDAGSGVGVLQTVTLDFNGGAPTSEQTGGPCTGAQVVTPPRSRGTGYSYLIFGVDGAGNAVGQIVTDVVTTNTNGVATATLTVPSGWRRSSSNLDVVVLGMVSPVGAGTPAKPASTAPYASSAFSVSTSTNPAPAYPSAVPVYQAAAHPGIPSWPVSADTSTLTTSAPSAEVGGSLGAVNVGSTTGVIATATLRDSYANPVNGMPVSIFNAPGSGGHAQLAPQSSSTGSTHPLSADDGTVSYGVVDACAETVTLRGSELTDIVGLPDATVQFVAGPPIAPDATGTPATCGTPRVTSSVLVRVDGSASAPGALGHAPADGSARAEAVVTAADAYGNPAACHQLVLAPISRTSRASVTPAAPANPCPGMNLPGYTGIDGVASFGLSSTRAETVAFGVTDTTKLAVWPVSVADNPTDVARVSFEGSSANSSSVVAASPSSPASGAPITVTMLSSSNQAVSGVTVSLRGCTNVPSPSSPCVVDGTAAVSPATVVTGPDGAATFTASTNSPALPRTVYFQATDVTDGFPLGQITAITFTRGGGSLSASPSSLLADGTDVAHGVFSLVSATGLPVSGASVHLAADSGAAVTPGTITTGSGGVATFEVTGTVAGASTVTASASYPSTAAACAGTFAAGTCSVSATTTLRFVGVPDTFKVTASPDGGIDADGIDASTVTVTALDAMGAPLAGVPVGLVLAGDGGDQAQAGSQNPVTSNTGKATFTVTDTAAEHVNIGAGAIRLSESSAPVPAAGCLAQPAPAPDPPATCSAVVTFIQTVAAASTVVASPDSAAADGTHAARVTVTLQDGAGARLDGHAVSLVTGSGTTSVASTTPGAVSGKDVPGQVIFTITDTKAETVFAYARDLFTGDLINQGVLLTFLPTATQISTVSAAPGSLPAGGPPGAPSTSTVTVQLAGETCTPTVAGHTIRLTTPSSSAVVSAPAVTSATGAAVFTVADPAIEDLVLTARDDTCGTTLAKKGTVSFTASQANRSTITATPYTSPAGGPAITLAVTLKTAGGAPIANRLVTVPDVSFATVTPISSGLLVPVGKTNSSGVAKFTVTDPFAEGVTFSATDGTTVVDQRVRVEFAASEANQSTVAAPVVSLPAGGPSTTVTVTLVGSGFEALPGHTVKLVSSSAKVTVTPATATSDAGGKATFSVSGTDVVSGVTLTATDTTTGVKLPSTVTLDFTANEQNRSDVAVSKTTAQVRQKSVVTVTLKDAAGHVLPGRVVTLSLSSPTATWAGVRPTLLGIPIGNAPTVTDAKGQIKFEVTDTTIGTVVVTATDQTGGVTLYEQPTIKFAKATLL